MSMITARPDVRKKNYECTRCTQNQAREKVGHYHHVTPASKWAWPVMLQLGHRYYITYGLGLDTASCERIATHYCMRTPCCT